MIFVVQPHFLIIKTSAIGDIVQAFPIAQYLKEKHPGCRVDWVVEGAYASLVEAHPCVDKAIGADTRSWRRGLRGWKEIPAFRKKLRSTVYDAVFDLQGNIKSGLIMAACKAKAKVGFSWKNLAEKPSWIFANRHVAVPRGLNMRERYLKVVQDFFADAEIFTPRECALKLAETEKWEAPQGLSVMVAFGSKWPNKQLPLPLLTRFLELAAANEKLFFYFVWGSESERLVAEGLHQKFPCSAAVGGLSFPLWQALMRKMKCVIAMDSAALHLAAMADVPTLSFFGPSLASVYKPTGDQHRHLQGTCPYGRTFEQRCPVLRTCPTGACMQGFTPEQMLQEFSLLLTRAIK